MQTWTEIQRGQIIKPMLLISCRVTVNEIFKPLGFTDTKLTQGMLLSNNQRQLLGCNATPRRYFYQTFHLSPCMSGLCLFRMNMKCNIKPFFLLLNLLLNHDSVDSMYTTKRTAVFRHLIMLAATSPIFSIWRIGK